MRFSSFEQQNISMKNSEKLFVFQFGLPHSYIGTKYVESARARNADCLFLPRKILCDATELSSEKLFISG